MENVSLAEKLFKKLIKKEREKEKLIKRKEELEKQAEENSVLAEYLDILNQISEKEKAVNLEIEPLRLAMVDEDCVLLEDKYYKVKRKRDYSKTVFNTQLFYENYKPTSKMYQTYIKEQNVKGSLQIEKK